MHNGTGDIVLATLNAKYIHASFGLRCLLANLAELRDRAALREFDITQRATDVAEHILSSNPQIVGLGVYIWNAVETLELVRVLRRLSSGLCIVLGGPEVSYEHDGQEIVELADYVICGEADLAFCELCRSVLKGTPPETKIIRAALPELSGLASPYQYYSDRDLAHRVLYVEASRGCPFTCEFCLSSIDIPVRQFPLEAFLASMAELWNRGARTFKFVDRTFNLNVRTAKAILEFFLARAGDGLFVHFEMVPDRLPPALRGVIQKFPAGTIQFEIGIQSFNPEVGRLISRVQDFGKLEENLRFLRNDSGVHLHVDLIVGLPGEDLQSFAAGFDRLVRLNPHEIQVGILKRLRGVPIVRHNDEWGMVYNPNPPYELLQNRLICFQDMQRMQRFARYWDLVSNSGRFTATLALLWDGCDSAFGRFLTFSDWLYARVGRRHAISTKSLGGELYIFLTESLERPAVAVRDAVLLDLQRSGTQGVPEELKVTPPSAHAGPPLGASPSPSKRQSRHLAARQ